MLQYWDLAVVGTVAAFSAIVGSVAGTGGGLLLLPVLVLYFGIQVAVPVMTVANLAANLNRAWLYRRELHWPVVGWFCLGAVPLTVVGAWIFTVAAPQFLTRLLGVVLLGMLVYRHLRPVPRVFRRARTFLPIGAGWGFLSGLMPGIGALMAPFYLGFGLVKGAYIGTDALATAVVQCIKLAVFGQARFLDAQVLLAGLILVPFMLLGTWLGKHLLSRLPERVFTLLIEATLVLAGLNFLLG